MHRREDDPQLEAEGELALARLALDGGDLRHAAGHLAGAVALAPVHPEVLEAFTQLTAEHGTATLDLFPITGHVYLGTAVARGYVQALLGRTGEAVETLCRASEFDTAGRWAHVPWLADPRAASAIEPDDLLRSLSHLIRALPGPAEDEVRDALEPYLTLTGRVLELHPRDGRLHGFASGLARRIGGGELATAWASRAVEIEPSALNEMFLGLAHRETGRVGEAVDAMRRAIAHDPFHLPLYSDLADLLARNGRLAEGLEWIARAEAIDADYDCVVHVGARLRYQEEGVVEHLVRLADYARTHPDTGCRHTDLEQACESVMWLGFLPDVPEPRTLFKRVIRRVAAPSAAAIQAIQGVTSLRLQDPVATYDQAVRLAALPVDDLLAVLTHPLSNPAWACLGLLHHRTDEPWPSSARRRILTELAYGSDGRISEAALFALMTGAWVDPSVRADVAHVVADRLGALTKTWRRKPRAIVVRVARLALVTPSLDARTRTLATEIAAEIAARGRGRGRGRREDRCIIRDNAA